MLDDRVVGLHLSIGGLGVVIESGEPDLEIAPTHGVAPFVAGALHPVLSVRAYWALASDRVSEGQAVFDSESVWQVRRAGEEFLFDFSSPLFGPAPYKSARVNAAFTTADVTLRRQYVGDRATIYPLEYPLDELLFIHLLAQGRGVELHACGVVNASGDAYLFVGQSGAGKSTMARLWAAEPGVTILSDDRIIVRKCDGRLLMYGTPWHGDEPFASNGPAPVAGIFFLRHGSRHDIRTIPVAEQAARLFASSFVPVYDANAIDFTLTFLEGIVGSVPCRELQFARDRSIVDFIRGITG